MGLIALLVLVAIAAAGAALLYVRSKRSRLAHRKRADRRDSEARRNTWVGATLRRNQTMKRITHQPPES